MFGANGNSLLDFETRTTIIGNINFILVALIAVTPLMKIVYSKLRPGKKRKFLHRLFNLGEAVFPLVLLLLSTLALVGDKYNPFLYFQF